MSKRDISDLKARLGLKKSGGQARRPTEGGSVPPPPGVKAPISAVPAPPGAKPPAPVLPSAADDPMAAFNAMAAHGAAQHAAKGPEIVVVESGGPVESVEQKNRTVAILKYAGIVIVPLAIGFAIGQISSGAKTVNRTIDAAAVLRDDVKAIRNAVSDNVLNELLRAKERGEGGNQFKLDDSELTEKLDRDDALPKIDPEKAFDAYMHDLHPELVHDILWFYSEAKFLEGAVKEHVKLVKNDARAFEVGKKGAEAVKPDEEINRYLRDNPYGYGVVIDVPTEKEQDVAFGARIVEIGPPVCRQDGKFPEGTNKCPANEYIGFGVREDGTEGQAWVKREFGQPQGEAVLAKRILPLVPTQVFDSLVKGGEAKAAEVGYMRRVNNLLERAQRLIELGVDLQKRLNSKAKESKSFSFFL